MKITILPRRGIRMNEVWFSTAYGEGKGIWQGTAVPPGTELEAEFELTALFMRWVDIVPATGSETGIRVEGEQVVLTGILENIEADGTGYLRIGSDLIMFECLGEPMMLGGLVDMYTRELELYPVNL
ncbi:hypothetical protein D3C73_1012100 [compost metagenome]